jgi:hypothetical protein
MTRSIEMKRLYRRICNQQLLCLERPTSKDERILRKDEGKKLPATPRLDHLFGSSELHQILTGDA